MHALAFLVGMLYQLLHRLCFLALRARPTRQLTDQLLDSSTDLFRATRFDLKALLPRISCTFSSRFNAALNAFHRPAPTAPGRIPYG